MQNKNTLQDKFKDFGAQPSDALWDSIAAILPAKKKKKAILFWWISSGIAATGALVFGLSFYFNNSNSHNKIAKVNTVKPHNEINLKLEKETENLEQTVQLITTDVEEALDTNTELEAKDNSDKTKTQLNTSTASSQVISTPTKSKSELYFEKLKANSKQYIQSESLHSELTNLQNTNQEHDIICKTCNSTISPRHIELLSTIFEQNITINPLNTPKKSRPFEYSMNMITFFNIKNKVVYNAPNQTSSADGSFSINESFSSSTNAQVQTSIPLALRFGIATSLSKRFKFQTGLDFGWIRTAPLNSENLFPKSSNLTVGIPLFLEFNIVNRRQFDINSKIGAINDFNLLEYDKGYPASTLEFTKRFLGGVEVGLNFDYKLTEKFKIGIGTSFRTYYYQSKPILNYTSGKNAFYSINAGLIWNY
jgi:hypothetical protein